MSRTNRIYIEKRYDIFAFRNLSGRNFTFDYLAENTIRHTYPFLLFFFSLSCSNSFLSLLPTLASIASSFGSFLTRSSQIARLPLSPNLLNANLPLPSPSHLLPPKRNTRVYPPFLSLKRPAISLKSLFTTSLFCNIDRAYLY